MEDASRTGPEPSPRARPERRNQRCVSASLPCSLYPAPTRWCSSRCLQSRSGSICFGCRNTMPQARCTPRPSGQSRGGRRFPVFMPASVVDRPRGLQPYAGPSSTYRVVVGRRQTGVRTLSLRRISVHTRLWRREDYSWNLRNPRTSTRSSCPPPDGRECDSAASNSPDRRRRTGLSPFGVAGPAPCPA
jgi:hypothetical protein